MRINALEAKTGIPVDSNTERVPFDTGGESKNDSSETQPPALPQPGELIERDISN
jgi:hypothetical protein